MAYPSANLYFSRVSGSLPQSGYPVKLTDTPPKAVPPSPGVIRRTAISTQRRKWRKAADHWDQHAGQDLGRVVDTVIAEATASGPIGTAVDVGAGTGALAVPLARMAKRVVAVDVSEQMLHRLTDRAQREDLDNIDIELTPIEQYHPAPASVDLVVSNYALHHLLDADKEHFVREAAGWLRPGGKLVIGDMMFGRGASSDDRRIIASKVRTFALRGPSGWWRIAKNGWRYVTRSSERPVAMERWVRMLEQAGFVDVSGQRVVAEAAVVSGRRP
jgi:ubiquinone/menaquinone biosynthesis C-methylase UbiE